MSTIYRTSSATGIARPHRKLDIAFWILQALVAAFLFFAGTTKLAGAEQMVVLFDAIGIGQWFRYITGLLEVAGAVLLVMPRFAPLGALLLAAVMAGAVVTHLSILGDSPLIPLVLFSTLLALAWVRRDRIVRSLESTV